MIPRPDEPARSWRSTCPTPAARRSSHPCSRRTSGLLKVGSGAVLGGRAGRAAAHRLSCSGIRGREAARHPQYRRTRMRQHRTTRRGDAQRTRARRRGDDARRPQRRGPWGDRSRRLRHRSSSPSPCCPVSRGRVSRAPASLAFEAKSSGLDGVVVSGEDVQRRAGGVRRRVLSRGAGHPARRRERARSGARADAGGGHRARRRLHRRRSPDHRCERSGRCRARRSSARSADRRDVAASDADVRNRRQRAMFALCRARGGCVYSPGSRPLPEAKERVMALPVLTPEQRTQALAKAAEARKKRAELKGELKSGKRTLKDVLDRSGDDIVGKMKVSNVLESLPGRRQGARPEADGGARHLRQPPRPRPGCQAARDAPREVQEVTGWPLAGAG